MERERPKKVEKFKDKRIDQALNVGIAQKREAERRQSDYESLTAQPFAQYSHDSNVNDIQKSRVRQDDPMAQYFHSKAQKEPQQTRGSTSSKPTYSGPITVQNRFNMKPGYRWDGVDRGSTYENRIILAISEKSAMSSEGYKLAVSDM
jgi:pre-mRNA-splicing factor CWC26